MYFAYELRDRDLVVIGTGHESGPPDDRRPTSEEYLPEKKLDLVELFVSLGSREQFWEIHHTAGNHLNNAWCRVPSARRFGPPRGSRGMPIVTFDRQRFIPDDGPFTVARYVALLPKADGRASTINDPSDEDTGFSGEIRLPWGGLGLPAKLRRPDGSYDLVGLELPMLAAALHGDTGQAVYHSSAELPLQMFHFSASRWPALSAGVVERNLFRSKTTTANQNGINSVLQLRIYPAGPVHPAAERVLPYFVTLPPAS